MERGRGGRGGGEKGRGRQAGREGPEESWVTSQCYMKSSLTIIIHDHIASPILPSALSHAYGNWSLISRDEIILIVVNEFAPVPCCRNDSPSPTGGIRMELPTATRPTAPKDAKCDYFWPRRRKYWVCRTRSERTACIRTFRC